MIIETSRNMQRRASGISDAFMSLVDSSFKGQLRSGDALGVWTFNDEVFTNQFPFKEWSPEERASVADRALGFFKSQRYEKRANLAKALVEMNRVARESEFLTVVLMTSGAELMTGTIFDQEVNQVWKQWYDQQQKARMPLLTLLRSRQGRITDWSVTPAPWPVDLPPMPLETTVRLADAPATRSLTNQPPAHETLAAAAARPETSQPVAVPDRIPPSDPRPESVTAPRPVPAPAPAAMPAKPAEAPASARLETANATLPQPKPEINVPPPAGIARPDQAPSNPPVAVSPAPAAQPQERQTRKKEAATGLASPASTNQEAPARGPIAVPAGNPPPVASPSPANTESKKTAATELAALQPPAYHQHNSVWYLVGLAAAAGAAVFFIAWLRTFARPSEPMNLLPVVQGKPNDPP